MNYIRIDPNRVTGEIDRNLFGGFAEHLGRCIYGGIYEPESSLAGPDGLRTDVLDALKRLGMPIIRYPGGNFASGYRWKEGVGPAAERRPLLDLAWGSADTNQFGTNEFVAFCRKIGAEPYLVANCGDGDMREARDWVEYCNGTQPTHFANLRRKHGFEQPHRVKYWAVGNEVDGPWQIGFRTPDEYARMLTEYAKVMKWVDPTIKLIASAVSLWDKDFVERAQLMIEQAGNHIDYMGLHWYIGNPDDQFETYMAQVEMLDERLSAYEGLVRALRLASKITRPIWIAVDEWNVWYRTRPDLGYELNNLEEIYNLEDALTVAMQINLFIRHAHSVKMANIAQIVNVIAPIFTRPDGCFLQTIFFPFELYSRTCGAQAVDAVYAGQTFSTSQQSGLPSLDISATVDKDKNQLVLYVVNRNKSDAVETQIQLADGSFNGEIQVFTVNGKDVKAVNSFDAPDNVKTTETGLPADGSRLTYTFEPHSVTALICPLT
jgi:alpha-N-arabinofuranosidase